MPQIKRPVDPTTGPLPALAHELQQLRQSAGLTYDAMAEQAHYSKTTLATADTGLRLPTLEVLDAYVRACGGDLDYFRHRWQEVAEQTGDRKLRRPANPLLVRPARGRGSSPQPDPLEVSTVDDFMARLAEVRTWAGLSFRQVSRLSEAYPTRLPRSTLVDMVSGTSRGGQPRLPGEGRLTTYLLVCGLTGEEKELWLKVRRYLEGGAPTSDPTGDGAGSAAPRRGWRLWTAVRQFFAG